MIVSFINLCVLLWLGHLARMRIRLLQKLYLPSSIIGGLVGLLVIQTFRFYEYPLPTEWTAGWSRLPGFLINIVFASLFLGAAIPSLSVIWDRAAPQLAYGQIVAWGQ